MRRISLLDGAALLALVPVVAFVAYASVNANVYFGSARGMAVYLGVPLTVAAALGLPFLLGREMRQSWFISFWSAVVALYAFEFYLGQVEASQRVPPPGADPRSAAQVVADLRGGGVDAYPAVTSKAFLDAGMSIEVGGKQILPLAGVPHAMTVFCNEDGTWATYHSDRFGFPNPDTAWDAPVQVVLIGDSYTQGACVDQEHSLAGMLRRNGRSVLNLGTRGSGPLAELAVLREYVARVRPRSVVWLFYYNDLLNDLPRERANPTLAAYLDPAFTQRLADSAEEVGRRLKSAVEEQFRRALAGEGVPAVDDAALAGRAARDQAFLSRINPMDGIRWLTLPRTRKRLSLFSGGNDWLPPDTETLARVLTEAKAAVEGWGGRLSFVALPSWDAAIEGDPEYLRLYRTAGIETARSLGLPTLDLTAVFRAQPNAEGLFATGRPGNHYSAAGYALAARHLAEFVVE